MKWPSIRVIAALGCIVGVDTGSSLGSEAAAAQLETAPTRARARERLKPEMTGASRLQGGGAPARRVRPGPFGLPRSMSGLLSPPGSGDAELFVRGRALLSTLPEFSALELRSLRPVELLADAAGGSHLVFEQWLDGLPVFNRGRVATLILHADSAGRFRGLTSNLTALLPTSLEPLLDRDDAVARVEGLEPRLEVQSIPELGILPTRAGPKLAWRMLGWIEGRGPRLLLVDAERGSLLLAEPLSHHAMTTGTGIDLYEELVTELPIYKGERFPVEFSPMFRPYTLSAETGAYNLVDLDTPDLGYIYTLTSNRTYLTDVDFVFSSDSSFDDGTSNNHRSGVTAAGHFRTTLDYFYSQHGRLGIDDAGLSVAAVVELVGDEDFPMECNAGWLGYGYNVMLFGMGGECLGYEFPSFARSLDVVAHELTHGINEFTIQLGYNHEAGALNESLSDVFGVLVEGWAEPPDWKIGEDLLTDPEAPWTAFRDLSQPSASTNLSLQSDLMSAYYTAPFRVDSGGVHHNSGIVNRAFYLMVAGGTVNGVRVRPLATGPLASRQLAARLYYDVMASRRLSSVSQLIDLRDALLDAAGELEPRALTTIRQAFQAVGLSDDLYPSSSQDPGEPNDYPLLAVPILVNQPRSAYLWARNDADLYAYEATARGKVEVRLSDLSFDAQLNVYLTAPFDSLEVVAGSDLSGTAEEVVSFEAMRGVTYYLEVVPCSNAGSRLHPYKIEVVASP